MIRLHRKLKNWGGMTIDPNRTEPWHRVMNAEQRIENLEAALGASLPVVYRTFLRSHREKPSGPVQVVSTNPDYRDVSCIFEIGDAESYLQRSA